MSDQSSDQSRRMKDKTAVDLVSKKGCGDSISGGRVDYCDEMDAVVAGNSDGDRDWFRCVCDVLGLEWFLSL